MHGARGPTARAPSAVAHSLNTSASAVGLTDVSGQLVARYTFTPFGAAVPEDRLASAEFFSPAPISAGLAPSPASAYLFDNSDAKLAAEGSRVGHQGLRFERLDRPWTSPLNAGDLGSGASSDERNPFGAFTGLYYNRARMYAPELGRFTTRDPNGLGGPFAGSLWHSGQSPTPISPQFDLQSHYADGMNTHVAYGGNPLGRRDPTGLLIDQIVSPYLEIGFTAGRLVHGLGSEYSANLLHDVEWAMDWSQGDDWHSRNDNSWVQSVYDSVGVNNTVDDYLNPLAGLTDAFGGGDGDDGTSVIAGRFGGGPIRNVGDVLVNGMRYVGKTARHHAVPLYLSRIMGIASPVLAKIPHNLHQAYHNHINAAFRKYGFPQYNAGPQKWREFMQKANKGGVSQENMNRIMKRILVDATTDFEKKKGLGGLVANLQDALR